MGKPHSTVSGQRRPCRRTPRVSAMREASGLAEDQRRLRKQTLALQVSSLVHFPQNLLDLPGSANFLESTPAPKGPEESTWWSMCADVSRCSGSPGWEPQCPQACLLCPHAHLLHPHLPSPHLPGKRPPRTSALRLVHVSSGAGPQGHHTVPCYWQTKPAFRCTKH